MIRRILALIGVIALAVLAFSAFAAALLGGSGELIFRLLAAAVFVPILMWLLLWGIGKTPRLSGGGEAEHPAVEGGNGADE